MRFMIFTGPTLLPCPVHVTQCHFINFAGKNLAHAHTVVTRPLSHSREWAWVRGYTSIARSTTWCFAWGGLHTVLYTGWTLHDFLVLKVGKLEESGASDLEESGAGDWQPRWGAEGSLEQMKSGAEEEQETEARDDSSHRATTNIAKTSYIAIWYRVFSDVLPWIQTIVTTKKMAFWKSE